MALDPRAPVIVGVGQVLQHTDDVTAALDPAGLMVEAVRRAWSDGGLTSAPTAQSVRVVSLLSWKYGDPGAVVGRALGFEPPETVITPMGGQGPQSLVNATAEEIQRGQLDLAILTGGEARRTRARARKAGIRLEWPDPLEDRIPRLLGHELELNHPVETSLGIFLPIQLYPLFESAIRAASGHSPDEHLRVVSELWSRFSGVAATNPCAWSRVARTAEQIRTPSPANRMVGLPYTKHMNSNNDVDMAAAMVMCSAAEAQRLGVPRDRWVFVHAGSDCHEHQYVSNRWTFADTPAIRLGGRRALELAGCTIDDVELIDLYSCFPSAVELGAQSLGLALDRQLTRTGGLAFAGGPWNNYVMHAIATIVTELRERPGQRGLVWANGGYVTKHSFGVYATEPPRHGFRHDEPQAVIDALPMRDAADDAAGPASVEAYTVMHDRDGLPETAIAACLLPDGRRAWMLSSDRDIAAAMCVGEWVGREVILDGHGSGTVR